jgi:hypothetical protein
VILEKTEYKYTGWQETTGKGFRTLLCLTFSRPMLARVEVIISFLSSLVRPLGMRRLACIDSVSQTLRVGTKDVSYNPPRTMSGKAWHFANVRRCMT